MFLFVEETAKVNAAYYVGSLLPMLIDDCKRLLPFRFVFQQDGAPAQDWLRVNCTDFIAKDEWPPNSPDLNPLDYHVWGAMLQAFHKLHPKPKTIAELTRGQSNLTKSASRGAHSPVRGHPRGSKVVPLNSWGRVSY